MDPVHGPGPGTTPWTTPNFQKEIAPVNIKIYRRSGFEKHRLVSIAYVLEGLSRISGLLWDRAPINGKTVQDRTVQTQICNQGILMKKV